LINHSSNLARQSGFFRSIGVRALACGLVFLGVCVFAWGLRYKLSLYDPPNSVSHRMPAAKLLAGRETSELPSLDVNRTVNSGVPAALLSLTLAFFLLISVRMSPGFSRGSAWLVPTWHKSSRVSAAPIFTRPPPHSR
jgi:hypothetical protein